MRYFERRIDIFLKEWSQGSRHKPLLLRGARQVGKSSAIRNLGRSFKYFLEVNFERDASVTALFKGNLRPSEISLKLSAYYGVPVVAGDTLLFFDEIQSCPEAIHSLWFFSEDYPELHVVAAGSLLEFALRKMQAFGVGRIQSLFMYPMSFDEFAAACGKSAWLGEKRLASADSPLFDALHSELVSLFRSYLMVGGMPEAVADWVDTADYLRCQQVHTDIIQTYEDDFSKYADRVNPVLLRQTLRAVAAQVGEKFVFRAVEGDHRSERVKEALSLLVDAGLIYPVVHTAANGLPLGAEINPKFTKYVFIDSGLLLNLLGGGSGTALARMVLTDSASDLVNKGSLTEMVAGLELLKYGSPSQRGCLYYWLNLSRNAQSEVDYVVAKDLRIVPIEVKSGTSGSMRSLHYMMQLKHIDYAVRLSLENFGRIGGVDIIPLYALSNLAGC